MTEMQEKEFNANTTAGQVKFNEIIHEFQLENTTIFLETGKIARQADGSVVVKAGETTVLCTVVAAKKVAPGADFFPLAVVFQEKTFAAGRIPGGFNKRESKLSDREVLISRLIDRTLRPLFPANFYHEVQIICTVLSYDFINEPDMLALIGAAAALQISGIPFHGPAVGVRVGLIDGGLTLNPNYTAQVGAELDIVISGTDKSILMVESEAQEVNEETILKAISYGHQEGVQKIIAAITSFAKEATEKNIAKAQWEFNPTVDTDLEKQVESLVASGFKDAYQEQAKADRQEKINAVFSSLDTYFEGKEIDMNQVYALAKKKQQHIVRTQIIKENKRIDGRSTTDIRPISSEIAILPRTHGSALFTRGETQAIVVTTLGTSHDEQIVDSLSTPDTREHFLLHYNFPPYSVGEVRMLRAPGRREIGHGNLAKRAINPMLPSKEDFNYTIRIVSEITESNGSSSMATVCGASLSLMDAGVPIKKPVAGIAMGLILEQDDYAILSDILGDEDNLGDMDFKVAGTEDGITALQMDIKVEGINMAIMQAALAQARAGRMHILGCMKHTIAEKKESLSQYAPVIKTIQINKDKIRELIGPGGKVIKDICEKTAVKIDINDDGIVKVSSANHENLAKAMAMIENIVAMPEMDKIYRGKVVKIADFGAFVNFMPGQDGLVHISEISNERVKTVSDVLKEGDEVEVKVIGIEKNGKVKLSIKATL